MAKLRAAERLRGQARASQYEVGDGCHDLAVRQGRFRWSKPHHGSPQHVASFSPGLDHVHVHDGKPYDRGQTGGRGDGAGRGIAADIRSLSRWRGVDDRHSQIG